MEKDRAAKALSGLALGREAMAMHREAGRGQGTQWLCTDLNRNGVAWKHMVKQRRSGVLRSSAEAQPCSVWVRKGLVEKRVATQRLSLVKYRNATAQCIACPRSAMAKQCKAKQRIATA